MSTWKHASVIFRGGTQQINALIGTRVRTRAHLGSAPLFDPINNTHRTIDLPPGTIGFVANPQGSSLLIAFPAMPGSSYLSLAALRRTGEFDAVLINEPTFKAQFEIESA